MNNQLVINIQKCSIHDGPGIRTTVFFKGCPLRCRWCHNPESQSYSKDILYNEEKCTKCLTCIDKCKNKAVFSENDNICTDRERCNYCETCTDYCINNAREIVGKTYTVKGIMKEIAKDMMFYEESGGGVTLSGGEVMTQDIDYIEKLIKECKDKGISVVIDTCGYAKWENFERILQYVDLFLYDIKLLDNDKHRTFTGKDNDLILNNLKKLSQNGANINIRIPLIDGVNTDDEEINNIIDFLVPLKISKVNLLPYHNIGIHKYNKLDMKYHNQQLSRPSEEKLGHIKSLFESKNFNTKIGG